MLHVGKEGIKNNVSFLTFEIKTKHSREKKKVSGIKLENILL